MIDISKLHSVKTEADVIGACIFNTDIYECVREMLTRELFTNYDTQKAFDVFQQLEAEGKAPDMMEVQQLLQKENVNITSFMSQSLMTVELTKQRIEFLQDMSIRRRLSALFYKGEVLTGDPTVNIDDIQAVLKELDAVMNNSAGMNDLTFGTVLDKLVVDVVMRREDRGTKGIMTGLHIFDSRFGWHGGDLVIIAGETSQGKSTLATTIAYNVATNGTAVAYYSLEMSAKQLAARIISRRVQVSSSMMLYAKLSDDEFNRVFDGSLEMKQLPIYFDENSTISFTKLCASIRRMARRNGVKVVFIDYLQIMANGHGDNREQLLGDMARDLKRLAKELDVCVVALSQLARDRNAKEPNLNRMRGSGQIEEACDIAVLIHRTNQQCDRSKIMMKKGRNIGLAEEYVRFNSALSYFCDYEEGDIDKSYQQQKEILPF